MVKVPSICGATGQQPEAEDKKNLDAADPGNGRLRLRQYGDVVGLEDARRRDEPQVFKRTKSARMEVSQARESPSGGGYEELGA